MSLRTSNKIKYFTFAFTLLMVIYHARGDFRLANPSVAVFQDHLTELYNLFGCLAMAFFFMMSGYLLYNNLTEANVYEKIKRRVKSLLIPFIIWNVIFMIAEIVILHKPINGVFDMLLGFSLFPYDGPLWYVFVIFVLPLFTPLMIKIANKRIHEVIVIITSLISLLIYFYISLNYNLEEAQKSITWIVRFCGYFPCYVVGSYIGSFHNELIEKTINDNYKVFIKIVLIVCVIIWVAFIDSLFFKEIFTIVSPVLLWITIDNVFFEKPMSKCCKNSFMIYAVHGSIISLIDKFIEPRLVVTSYLSLSFWFLQPYLCVMVVYMLCYIVKWLLSKLGLSKITTIITGGRE